MNKQAGAILHPTTHRPHEDVHNNAPSSTFFTFKPRAFFLACVLRRTPSLLQKSCHYPGATARNILEPSTRPRETSCVLCLFHIFFPKIAGACTAQVRKMLNIHGRVCCSLMWPSCCDALLSRRQDQPSSASPSNHARIKPNSRSLGDAQPGCRCAPNIITAAHTIQPGQVSSPM